MPIPQGATTVVYNVSQYGEGVEINQKVLFYLPSSSPESVDAAAQAAMEAFIAYLEQQSPLVNVSASRKYECALDGDVWPSV